MNEEINQIVKMDGIGDVFINLVNKLSQVFSWVATRETPSRIAIQSYINELKSSDLPPLEKAARITRAKKDIREYANQLRVVELSANYLESDAHPEDIEDNWICEFMEKIKNVSNEDFQQIWGKILAGEANKPGSFSLRTLMRVSLLSNKDAECFTVAVSEAVFDTSDTPHILRLNNNVSFSLSDILRLDECGLLVYTTSLVENVTLAPHETKPLFYNGSKMALAENCGEQSIGFSYGVYEFSNSGLELFHAVLSEASNKSFQEGIREIESSNEALKVFTSDMLETDADNNLVHNSRPFNRPLS